MKTLSDDITLTLNTAVLIPGYVTMTVYYNSIGVFVGRTTVVPQRYPVEICLNDFIVQNHGRNDFLKLNNAGELVSNGLNTGYEQLSKFEIGQVGRYSVSLVDGDNHLSTESSTAVAGYNYQNKDIEPTILKDDSSSDIGRVMQGSDWFVKHEDERGVFNDLLVPHLPAIPTKKFGMGLQIINAGQIDYPFAIKTSYGNEVSIGYTEGPSDATFITLYDIYQNTSINDAEDTSLFLKYQGSSGDEFGDMQEGFDRYRGHLSLQLITVTGRKNGSTTYLGSYSYNAPEFADYVGRYIPQAGVDWDLAALTAGQSEVYTTNWYPTVSRVTEMLDVYKDNYGATSVPKVTPEEQEFDYIIVSPIYTDSTESDYIPDKYIGKCTVAVLDSCYSRYYLAWMDRFGDIQSQAFDGKIEYSEDFERNEIKDYKLRRRIIHNEVQPQWRLNTKWLKEDIYPMYESIFTSPYLLLYDTETDRAWNVILTDSNYKEKTFKTEKKLFNLEINVEANTKQNYIF